MTKREAKKEAHAIVDGLIDSYFHVEQPYDKVADALRELQSQHRQQGQRNR